MAWVLDPNTVWYLVLVGGASIFYTLILSKFRLRD